MILKTADSYELQEHGLKGFLNKGLAPRELIAMLLKANGMKAKEISAEMDCALITTNKRFQNINFKLKAKNATHSLSEAFRKGIIIHYTLLAALSTGLITNAESQIEQNRLRTPRSSIRVTQRSKQEHSA